MKPFRRIASLIGLVLLAFALLGVGMSAVNAQSSGVVSVYPINRDIGAAITMTAQGAATVTSSDLSAAAANRVVCVYNQTAHGGSPSSTFTIQGKDAASGAYYALLTSAAITADTTPTPLHVGPGLTTTANVSAGLVLPKTWRISLTVGGTGTPTVTGTIGCNLN